jgi:hypothetical protein
MKESDAPCADYAPLLLRRNPFILIAPVGNYEIDLQPLFSAREAEVNRTCRLAANATALFICAPFGGGKTVLVLEALSRLRRRAIVTVYVQFDPRRGFRASVHEGMRAAFDMAGADTFTAVRTAVRATREHGSSIVLAMDDLDRAGDIAEIYQVTHDVRDLVADGASVVVTGQPFGVTHDLHTSAGGIFHEVVIPEFSQDDFHEMLSKYLQSVHLDGTLSPTHPFDAAAAQFVCREVAAAKLTPRLFNFAVSELLELAMAHRTSVITMEFALFHWEKLALRAVNNVTRLQLEHLKSIFRAVQVSEDTPQAINELGGSGLAEYPEVRDTILRPLLVQNLLQVQRSEGKEIYQLTPHSAAVLDSLFSLVRSPPVPFDRLLALLDRCSTVQDAQEKGEVLEQFASLFFSHIPGFRVPPDGSRLRTDAEELDVAVEIAGIHHHAKYGTFTVCECKNWTTPVSWDELAVLREKLVGRRCKCGIFLALNGVTAGFREKMKAFLRDGIVIVLLTETELRKNLEGNVEPVRVLEEAYYATIKYEGEAGS